jgi:hypothetical protein
MPVWRAGRKLGRYLRRSRDDNRLMDLPPAGASIHWDTGETLADRFRAHASDADNLYGYATRGVAEDWEAGGPTRIVCRGYENAPRRSVINLRLLAGVFRLVLTGRAPELVPFYLCLGGTAPASQAWPVMREVIGKHVEELHSALAVPPQTNEVGRSVALLVGLFDLVAGSGVRSIRLLELGASAGLNLLLDRYAYRGDFWQFGFSDSEVQFVNPIEGRVRPEHFMITARAGCDLHPVDATTAEGRLLLTSFVWPFDLDRHERLSSALAIAATHPVCVDKASASSWLPRALAADRDELPVVWHSITQMYWPNDELTAVERILSDYGSRSRLGEVSLEYHPGGQRGAKPELRTRLWDSDAGPSIRERLIGTAQDHGVPVTLISTPS